MIVQCKLKDFGCNEQIQDHYLSERHQHAIIKLIRQLSLQSNDRQIHIDLPRATTTETCTSATCQLEEFYEMLNILTGGIETLASDEQRLNNESLQMQITLSTLVEESPKVKLSIEESKMFLEAMKHNQDILNHDFLSLQEKINDLECVSYDGTFVWKITSFPEKMSKLKN
ncbi:unnamed protein product [Rotaria sp. Silwood2]|nr:unnamed protein product [Rotaria sp. Silwood2]